MRLLKKLRTTRRTRLQATRISARFSHGLAVSPIVGRASTAAACLGLAFTFNPVAGQQFYQSNLPSPPPQVIQGGQSQAQFEHAEALRGQMLRAQAEQGAGDGFAEKAFVAQQNYLAQQAHLQTRAQTRQNWYDQAVKRIPKPRQQQVQQSTFAPPVHIAPQNSEHHSDLGVASFSNHPGSNARTEPHRQSAVPVPYYQDASAVRALPTEQIAYQTPRQAPRYTAPHQAAPHHVAPRQLPNPQSAGSRIAPNEFIFEERGSIGLQDRIASMLSKPRYQGTSQTQPIQAQSVPATRVVHTNPPVQRASADVVDVTRSVPPQVTQKRQPPSRSRHTSQLARRNSPVAHRPHHHTESQYAREMQQRIDQGSTTRLERVQQVAMVSPRQDPFNDHVRTLPQGTHRPVRRELPARQMSVLSGRQQTQDDANQFGSEELSPPTEDVPTQSDSPSFEDDTDTEFRQFDQDLNRQLEELNRAEQDVPEGSGSRVDEMEDELEREVKKSRERRSTRPDSLDDERLDEDDFSDDRTGPRYVQKTCDEFRYELLGSSIRDIALDISPPASQNRDQYVAISRNWTDRSGATIASGAMVDLRRGYVIIDGLNGLQKIPYSKLSEADWAAVSDYWQLPELCSVGNNSGAPRCWIPQTYTWKASSLCHKPLFFEDIQLERYGHTHGPFSQPIHSIAHFFVSWVTVPYRSAITPANECQYALGFYRPGNCAPWLKDPIPFSLSGVKRQALVTTGLAFIP